jgi:UDPglucose--hexose-1-phosphate uridylyltransferase
VNITQGKWEKRWHPLREEWVVYSAHRNARPWHGAPALATKPSTEYDPSCYLCPGNKRVHGDINPLYNDIFIFENDHPVVSLDAPAIQDTGVTAFYQRAKALGMAKVICYDPRHNITLSKMKIDRVVRVFKAFQEEMLSFKENPAIKYVHFFENKGEAVGVSNPHPHCQVYATDFTFKLIEQQIRISNDYQRQHQRNIFEEIILNEQREGIRIITENEFAIAFIPFFARYAYETMIFPKRQHQSLITLSSEELEGLSKVFHETVRRMDMNFSMDFPYVMSIMQAPVDGANYSDFRMHLWLQPPYRQPGLIKYLAGPEIGGGSFMADTMPEDKAAELRKINIHDYSFER